MKVCKRCGQEKPLGGFYAAKGCKDGLRPECKECHRAAIRAHRDANIEEQRKRDRDRYANNPVRREAVKEAAAKRYVKNRDLITAQQRARYEQDKERICAEERAARAADPEPFRAKQRAYLEANREKVNARRRAYREKNKEAFAAKYREQYGTYAETYKRNAVRRRALLLSVYVEDVEFDFILQRDNGVCGICSQPVMEKTVELDHILPLAAGGWHERANVQLAHRACNRKKAAQVGFTLAETAA